MADFLVNGVDDAPTSYATVAAAITAGAGNGDTINMTVITDENSLALPAGCDLVGASKETSGIEYTTANKNIFDSVGGDNTIRDVRLIAQSDVAGARPIVTGDVDNVVVQDAILQGGSAAIANGIGTGHVIRRVRVLDWQEACISGGATTLIEDCVFTGTPVKAGGVDALQIAGAWTVRNTVIDVSLQILLSTSLSIFGYFTNGNDAVFDGCIFKVDTSKFNTAAKISLIPVLKGVTLRGCTAYVNAGSGTAKTITGTEVGGFTSYATLINSPTCEPALSEYANFDPLNIDRSYEDVGGYRAAPGPQENFSAKAIQYI